ncbi:MAG: protein kinase, partial [Deltaproteobacteria bacterium]|nr:protein kinase [Deltaproteobacteria bacterium]
MLEFGAFRYDAESRVLSRDQAEIHLSPRVLAVLESLLKRPGEIVAKEAVLESAWEGAFVGEDSLTQAISQLRSALGDDPQRPIYIQTIPKRGYRFIAEVSAPLRSKGPIPQPVSDESEDHTLVAGTKVGNYELLSHIGAGAMGEVWRARDVQLQRDVAIKVVPKDLAGEATVIERFRREALMLAAVNHPNIAAIHGVEEADGQPFIVMELLEGETLQERLQQGPLSIDESLEFAAQIARALEVAHDAGIIHRDLKPANIMLGPGNHVKVLDFGLAKDANASDGSASVDPTLLTESGLLIGTAAYMSPEQAAGRPVDKRSDIFSFGCILFEMLTSRRPFPGDSVSEIVAATLKDQPDWELLPASTPVTAGALLRRCLRKNPDRRLHDIADARIEIEEALDEPAGGPSEAHTMA